MIQQNGIMGDSMLATNYIFSLSVTDSVSSTCENLNTLCLKRQAIIAHASGALACALQRTRAAAGYET